MFLLEFPFSKRVMILAWNGTSLAGRMTRSGTLDARPKQNVCFSTKRRDYTIKVFNQLHQLKMG